MDENTWLAYITRAVKYLGYSNSAEHLLLRGYQEYFPSLVFGDNSRNSCSTPPNQMSFLKDTSTLHHHVFPNSRHRLESPHGKKNPWYAQQSQPTVSGLPTESMAYRFPQAPSPSSLPICSLPIPKQLFPSASMPQAPTRALETILAPRSACRRNS